MKAVLPVVAALCVVLSLAAGSHASPPSQPAVRNLNHPHVMGELLIKYRDDVAEEEQLAFIEDAGGQVKHRFRASGAVLVEFPESQGVLFYELATEIANLPMVEYVEANTIVRAVNLPDDPRFAELWGMHNTGQTEGTAGADIEAATAWDQSTGSRDVVVAIIDTGVNYLHPDLAPNYWSNPGETGTDDSGNDRSSNGIDDDGNGYVDDWRGWDFVNNDNDPMDDNSSTHGSHCAGTIGAAGNDGFGIAGVAWEVSLVGVKFLSASGSGSLANAVKAIEYANTLGIAIQSNSWGGGGFSQVMYDAIEEAKAKDILFVAAAGNAGGDNDSAEHFPSSYTNSNVLAVAATDHNDTMASFSNWGVKSVDVAAPGVDILSCSEGEGYRTLSGTSMATPHVAGLAALVKAKYSDATYEQVKARIINGVDRLDQLRGKVLTGGRINAANALEDDDQMPAQVDGLAVSERAIASILLSWNPSGDDGHQGQASNYEIRYADQPIVTEDQWDKAFVPVIQMSGSSDAPQARLSGFPFNYVGYVAVRAMDNVGNLGTVSASYPMAVAEVDLIFTHTAEAMNGVEVTGTWGLEAPEESVGNVFSDSPNGFYTNDSESVIKLDSFDINTSAVMLVYRTWMDIERSYDFGFVELSTDGGANWMELESLTGRKGWHTRMIDLEPHLKGLTQFAVRFRLKTDYVVEADGWHIDDIQLIAEK